MPVSPSAALSRRHLLLAGAVGLSSLAALGSIAPARAEDVWTEEFMTRPETREGFLLDDMDEWQVENAKFVIAVIKGHGLDEQAATITLATAIVESWLRNYEPAVDLDSGGLFQQRPSMGWGTYDEVRHKKRAIDAFLGLGDHSEAPACWTSPPTTTSGRRARPRRPCRSPPTPSATPSRSPPHRPSGPATPGTSPRTPTDPHSPACRRPSTGARAESAIDLTHSTSAVNRCRPGRAEIDDGAEPSTPSLTRRRGCGARPDRAPGRVRLRAGA